MDRSQDWMAQAEHLLEQAEWLRKGSFHDGACFHCQQSAEMSVKAVYHVEGRDAWGHMIVKLLNGLVDRIEIPSEVFNSANELDRFYVPTRYPNGFEEGSPKDYFDEDDTIVALAHCRRIVRFCKECMDYD